MKKTILLAFVLLICLCSCNSIEKIQYKNNSENYIDMDVNYKSENIVVEYSHIDADEIIIFKQPKCYDIYQILNPTSFKKISFSDVDHSKLNYISLWFKDTRITNGGFCGSFGIYENDIVIWSGSVFTSFCKYYKAPEGTFKKLCDFIAK